MNIQGSYYTYFSNGSYNATSTDAIALINGSYAVILGSKGSSNYTVSTLSQNAQIMLIGNMHTLTDEAETYYTKKKVPVIVVERSKSLLRELVPQ